MRPFLSSPDHQSTPIVAITQLMDLVQELVQPTGHAIDISFIFVAGYVMNERWIL
jgi:hypothetical protein